MNQVSLVLCFLSVICVLPLSSSVAADPEIRLDEIIGDRKKPPTLHTVAEREAFLKALQMQGGHQYFQDNSGIYWEVIADGDWQATMIGVEENKLIALFGFETDPNMAAYCEESDKENPIFGLEWIGDSLPG